MWEQSLSRRSRWWRCALARRLGSQCDSATVDPDGWDSRSLVRQSDGSASQIVPTQAHAEKSRSNLLLAAIWGLFAGVDAAGSSGQEAGTHGHQVWRR
uniref:Uncharacterized protein n=1 Tax=Oryza punctata TaxID=4537 RepID=A0A0E0LRL3_ORYPU